MITAEPVATAGTSCKLQSLHVPCNIGSLYHASIVRGCVPVTGSFSLIYHFWFFSPSLWSDVSPPPLLRDAVAYSWKLHTCKANNHYFLYLFLKLIICRMYLVFIIIIIIRKGRQCKAGREPLTPYQSEDPNPTTPTHRMKEKKGKTVGDKKWASS